MNQPNVEEMITGTGRQILDDLDACIYGIRYQSYELVYGNRASRKKFTCFQTGETCYKILHGRTAPCDQCPMARVEQGEQDVNISVWMDGANQWLQVLFNDSALESGEHICLCTASDITGLKESARMTENVLNGIHAAAYTIGADNYRILSVNTYLRKLLPGIKEGDLCYRALWDKESPCGHCPVPRLTESHNQDTMKIYNDKLGRHLSIDSIRVRDGGDKPVVIFTGYDITSQVEAELRLKDIAYKDVLLHINNRNSFMEDLSMCFEKGGRYDVYMSRLKNFDNYNLTFGKDAGDNLLQELAAYYSSLYPGTIYRVGGARFAYIAATEAERNSLDNLVKKPIPETAIIKHRNFRFYMDHVIVEIPRFAGTPEILIHNGEYMLHKTRNSDNSEVLYFCSKEQKELERKNRLTEIVRHQIQTSGLEVYYQPIYSIEETAFTKCEALVRLHDEEFGYISPMEFIPIAEECGLISQLGAFVLDDACRQIMERKRLGLPPVRFNVNVSTVQFSTDCFYDTVMDTVNQYDFDHSLLQLEVTESILINSFDYIVEIMKKLIEQGISFAVDDFGTGYSSLSYIGTLPVACLKLDKSFIDHIARSEVYVLIVKNVMEIAKGLNFKIVAEGVESYGQYQILKKLGCDYIQGYLFSKPLPPAAFRQFLDDHYRMQDHEITYTDGTDV